MTDAATQPTLRQRFSESLKAAMKGGDQTGVGTIRLILAKLKETDIAARDLPLAAFGEGIVAAVRNDIPGRGPQKRRHRRCRHACI